jgi:hypothetical protein
MPGLTSVACRVGWFSVSASLATWMFEPIAFPEGESPMKKTYVGGCHCGAVRYEADIDLSAGTLKCNCSICTKVRNWLVFVKPDEFRLRAGETELSDYQFGAKRIHHLFCKHCGVHSFGRADAPELGGKSYAVNVNCLADVNIDELVSAPINYVDGRNDNWKAPPAETRHL